MKTLLIGLFLMSSKAIATTYIVEMQRELTFAEIKTAQLHKLSVELFDRTPTPYFKRTYRIESQNKELIQKILPVKLIEHIHRAEITSLKPSAKSEMLRPDQLFQFQWGLYNQNQIVTKAIGTTKLISTQGKSGVDIRWKDSINKIEAGLKKEPVVAVIDMGIDFDHPDLKGSIFKNTKECDEKGEIADHNEDRDENGLKGDCMGWNFTARTMGDARRPIDDTGHGTHVSGIMAAQTNKIGLTGVSSKIKILPIKVTGRIDESSDRKTIQPLTDRVAKGILYAANMGVDVINLSMGWTRSMDTKYLNEAINFALSRGIILVAAAGNNNNNATIFPCAHYDVICVGAIGIDGKLADFSNYGGEVDVLAPGDEIISTIPLNTIPMQLNLQGYDIRSGTSQAAPFVSALAALFRGNYPQLHRDEITRRIVDSADPTIKGKSLNGLINYQAAFEMPKASLVRPIFKRFSTALFDAKSLRFQFPLQVKNFGFDAKNVKVSIKSLSESLSLDQENTFEILRPGQITGIRLNGEIKDLRAHSLVKIEVTVNSDGDVKSYQHEFRLARDILKEEDIRTLPFAFNGPALPMGKMEDNQVRNLINTVEVPHQENGYPEYYLPRQVKENSSFELKFFRKKDSSFDQVAGAITLPGALQLLNVMKLDLNFDGEDDYLIRAIGCDKNCADASKASRYLQYSLWKKDLSPLFGHKSIWKFLPTLVNVDIKSQRFYKLQTKDFGPVAVPMFIETSVIPDSQQKLTTAFDLPDRSVARRVYFLSPTLDKEGKVNLETRTLSTKDFLTNIRLKHEVAKDEEVQAVHLLAQSKAELDQGKVEILLSIGKGFDKLNVLMTAGSNETTPFSIKQNIWGYEHSPSQNLDDGQTKDAFVGLVSKSRLVMIQTGLNTPSSYNSANSVEAPLAPVASFTEQDSDYTFFQTPSYLMLAQNTGSQTELYEMKINRFSFLPGTLFNDSFYPVQVRRDGKNLPALYVDETDIQNDLVSLTIFDEKKLQSPIGTSSFVPPICKALNPVRLSKDESYSVSLLCLENKQWVMKFKEMK